MKQPTNHASVIKVDEMQSGWPCNTSQWGSGGFQGRGDGLEVEPMSRNPEGRGSIPRLCSLRSSLISIEHAELLV